MSFFPTQNRYFSIPISGVQIGTAGSPVDRAILTVPPSMQFWAPDVITVRAVTAAGTLAAGTFDIRTDTGGLGASLLVAPVALTSLTATGTIQIIQGLTTSLFTSTGIVIRQTVDSLNLGSGVFTFFGRNYT